MRMHDEEDLPVLDAVVRGGDPTIIRGLRMGRETLQAIESLRRLSAAPALPGAGDGSPIHLDAESRHPVPGGVAGRVERGRAREATRQAAKRTRARIDGIDILLERPVDVLRRELREMLQGRGRATADAWGP